MRIKYRGGVGGERRSPPTPPHDYYSYTDLFLLQDVLTKFAHF